MADVLVINAGYEPLHRVSLKHAINMLWREVAVVEEAIPGATFGPFPRPLVVRLVRYVRMGWRHARRAGQRLTAHYVKNTWDRWSNGVPTYSRQGVLDRDKGRCAYCGRMNADTMDHVLPRSRGGATDWSNAVAACVRCNQLKANRTPEEAGMPLLWLPFVPTLEDLRY